MSFFSFLLSSILTLTPINPPTMEVSVSVVKPELNLSYFTIEKLESNEITLQVNVTNSGTLSADPTTVHLMFPDALSYKSSSHKAGILTSDFSRFFKVLRWEIPTLAVNETQETQMLLTIPKDQIDTLSIVDISAVFSTPNGVAVSMNESLELSADQKKSTIQIILDFFRRILFWWHVKV